MSYFRDKRLFYYVYDHVEKNKSSSLYDIHVIKMHLNLIWLLVIAYVLTKTDDFAQFRVIAGKTYFLCHETENDTNKLPCLCPTVPHHYQQAVELDFDTIT